MGQRSRSLSFRRWSTFDAGGDRARDGTHRWAVIILILVAGAVHATGISGARVFDDETIFESEALKNPETFRWFQLTNRPFGQATFALQFATLGRSEEATHLVNIAIHLLATLGLYHLLWISLSLTAKSWLRRRRTEIASGAALMWSVHPLTTAAVTYQVQRYEALAAALMLWSVYAWLRSYLDVNTGGETAVREQVRPSWWCVSLLLAGCAFGTKETSAALPFAVLLADRALLRNNWRETLRRGLGVAVMLIPILVGATMRVPTLVRTGNRTSTIGYGLVGIDPVAYIAAQPLVFLKYLQLTVWPVDQVLDYGWLPPTSAAWLAVGWCGWGMLLVAIVWAWSRWRLIGWMAAWAVLVLATTSLVPTQDLIFEHRFYLPLALLIGCAAIWCGRMTCTRLNDRLLIGGTIVISGLLSLVTVMRNQDYATAVTLAYQDLERQPENPRNVYRVAQLDKNLPPERRLALIARAIELSERRGYFYAGTNYKWRRELADQLFLRGALDSAEQLYLRALQESHDDLQQVEVEWSLALVSSLRGEVETANEWFRRALAEQTPIQAQIDKSYREHLRKHGISPQCRR